MKVRKLAWLTPLLLIGLVAGVSCDRSAPTGGGSSASSDGVKLKIASYEPTVELYKDLNAAFPAFAQSHGGKQVPVPETAHGPSGTQAKKIAEGNEVDIAALSVDFDIDKIVEAKLIDKDWRAEFPNDSVPYTSSVLFLVRKGNPKGIKDWEDLGRDDVAPAAPDPKTGGGARWIYLSAWAHGVRKAKAGGAADADAQAAGRELTRKIYDKALLNPAMRQSTTRFVSQGEGDVLFGWENEILQITNDPRVNADYDLVVPSDSIVIEVPVAIVDHVVDKRGTRDQATQYINFLYSPEGQEIIAKRFNRPSDEQVAKKYAQQFKPLDRYRFKEYFSSWPEVMKQHFSQGGELDQMRGGAARK